MGSTDLSQAAPASADHAADLLKGGMATVSSSLDEFERVAARRETRMGRAAWFAGVAGVALLFVARRLATQRRRLRRNIA